MKAFNYFLGLSILLLSVASCKKEKGESAGTLTAKVNGIDFRSSTGVQASLSNGALSFGGVDSTGQITVTIPGYTGPGVYNISSTATTAVYITATTPVTTYIANLTSGSGSVNIISLNNGLVTGTFNFVANHSGSGGTRTVTDGSFQIRL